MPSEVKEELEESEHSSSFYGAIESIESSPQTKIYLQKCNDKPQSSKRLIISEEDSSSVSGNSSRMLSINDLQNR